MALRPDPPARDEKLDRRLAELDAAAAEALDLEEQDLARLRAQGWTDAELVDLIDSLSAQEELG